ncbi:MAG: phosphoribosylanthranilate isomerase [Cytophagales bacterium]|nr:phosphoribosylanthranilate isomerase [Cytophagales bacterium]
MTKIKICGLTREQDVDAAVAAGADAVGFVMYAQSPRAVSIERAAELAQRLPPFVTPVLLFVNELEARVHKACEAIPTALLQFHGDDQAETAAFCESFKRPYLRAARIVDGFDLVKYATEYSSAQGLLLDAYITTFGGSGTTFNWNAFNWSQLSTNVKLPLVLSGGLTPANVREGIALVKPWAVDVSSGVERARGIKDSQKIADFVLAVKQTDRPL